MEWGAMPLSWVSSTSLLRDRLKTRQKNKSLALFSTPGTSTSSTWYDEIGPLLLLLLSQSFIHLAFSPAPLHLWSGSAIGSVLPPLLGLEKVRRVDLARWAQYLGLRPADALRVPNVVHRSVQPSDWHHGLKTLARSSNFTLNSNKHLRGGSTQPLRKDPCQSKWRSWTETRLTMVVQIAEISWAFS